MLFSQLQSLVPTSVNNNGFMDTTSTAAAVADVDNTKNELSVWQGRVIVLAAAAIFGTNFATVKMLDQVVPTSVSMALRFVLAAVAISASVAWQHQSQQRQLEQANLDKVLVVAQDDTDKARRLLADEWMPAAWLGAEVGAWYLVGYLCQSYGLHYVAASKVRTKRLWRKLPEKQKGRFVTHMVANTFLCLSFTLLLHRAPFSTRLQ